MTSKRWFKPVVAAVAVVVLFHVFVHLAITRCWGCRGADLALPETESFGVAIVPGCPSMKDGGLSACQWRRAVWAAELHETGVVSAFITSGSAVYNRYVEADALRAGMAVLGVPLDRIHTETQALHTDENMAYSMAIAARLGHVRVAVASDGVQVVVSCAMLRMWGTDCLSLPMDEATVAARMAQGMPLIRTPPVSEATWMDLSTREAARARVRGDRSRLPSLVVYLWGLLRGLAGQAAPPPLPPEGL